MFPPVVHINCKRFNICAHGFINCPYLFVFDWIQVIREDTVFQGSGFKKWPGGSAESDASNNSALMLVHPTPILPMMMISSGSDT